MNDFNFRELCDLIQKMRRVAEDLKEKGEGIEAVKKNVDRILANVRMLELNVSDLSTVLQ